MHRDGTAQPGTALALTAVEDEDLAAHSVAKLLISGASRRGVETVARRIHGAGRRAQFPFVHERARRLPVEPKTLREHCARALDAAAGGSLLVSNVEEMLPAVQEALIDLLAELESACVPSATVRLISGTTVSLSDRVVAGTFSARLFYRLNTIHLVAGVPIHMVERVSQQ